MWLFYLKKIQINFLTIKSGLQVRTDTNLQIFFHGYKLCIISQSLLSKFCMWNFIKAILVSRPNIWAKKISKHPYEQVFSK